MLEAIAIILIVLWLVGLVSGYTIGNVIRLLLVIAVVLLLPPRERTTRRLRRRPSAPWNHASRGALVALDCDRPLPQLAIQPRRPWP